jgi:hypothetical protein
MFPGTGYFSTFPCPYAASGLCQRPYCHFKHVKRVPEQERRQREAPREASGSGTVPGYSTQKSLEDMVQDAVKKVLRGDSAADLSGILANINRDTISETVREIKQEKVEAAASTSSAAASAEEADSGIAFDSRGRRLYLQPKDAPAYNPTPIEELKKMKREVPAADDEGASSSFMPNYSTPQFSPPHEVPAVNAMKASTSSYIPTGLAQMSSLKRPMSSKLRKVSKPKKTPALAAEDVLGDIGDLSDDDSGEDKDSPNVIGSILMSKTSVFSNVNEFEHEFIKNKLKMKNKAAKQKKEVERVSAAAVAEDQTMQEKISCDMVSSSSEGPKEADAEEPKESEEEKRRRLEQEEAKRVVEQKERELLKLEEKRLVLENFYRNKRLSIDSNLPESAKQKGGSSSKTVVKMEKTGEMAVTQTIVISSEGEAAAGEDEEKTKVDDASELASTASRDGIHQIVSRFLERFRYMCPLLFSCVFPS